MLAIIFVIVSFIFGVILLQVMFAGFWNWLTAFCKENAWGLLLCAVLAAITASYIDSGDKAAPNAGIAIQQPRQECGRQDDTVSVSLN